MNSVARSELNLDSLPGDVLTRIAHRLPGEFVAAMQLCTTALYKALEPAWESLYQQRWGCVLELLEVGPFRSTCGQQVAVHRCYRLAAPALQLRHAPCAVCGYVTLGSYVQSPAEERTWKQRYGTRHVKIQTMLQKLHADLSRSNCPQRSSDSKWQAFSLWNEPAIVHVSIRDWQRHQEALAESCASLEDLVRLIDLHAGPLALIAAIQFLITCICRPSSAVPGSSSELSARSRFEQMEATSCTSPCQNTQSPTADSGEVDVPSSDVASQLVNTCTCSPGTHLCPHCAWQALLQLEAMLTTCSSSSSPVTLRTWRLGELQPLAGWRTRDRMSSVRSTHPQTS